MKPLNKNVIDIIEKWVENHPKPDDVFYESLEGRTLTPKEFLKEVKTGTTLGSQLIENILETYLAMYLKEQTKAYMKKK